MKVLEFIEKEELIKEFAKEMARLQIKADRYYYLEKDRDMADFVLNYASEVKKLASKLRICDEMYILAYKLYDFRSSGRTGNILSQEQLEDLRLKRDWED